MELRGKKFLVIGGAGLIGSHTVDLLLEEDVGEIIIYDNFARGSESNLKIALQDKRVTIFQHGGDILQADILNKAMEGVDGVFHFAALWLNHCHNYPNSAFDVNVRGTFNVMEACVDTKTSKLVYSSLRLSMAMHFMNPWTKVTHSIIKIFMEQQKLLVNLCLLHTTIDMVLILWV